MQIKKLESKRLFLNNDGSLELIFIGVGSAFSKIHNQTNLLIVQRDDHLLIDCGTKCPQALFELGLPISAIRNLFITHSHADHIGGLEEVILVGRYVSANKPQIIITQAYQEMLWQNSLLGGAGFNEGGHANPLNFEDFFVIKRPKLLKDYPRDTFEANVGDINLKMMRTWHIPNIASSWKDAVWSCGVIINNRVLFTGDTLFDAPLITEYDDIFHFEAIFHDCQFFSGGVHSSLDELSALPENIKSRIYLTHFGDNWRDFIKKAGDYGFAGFAEEKMRYIFS